MIVGINHIAVHCSDLTSSIDFYKNILLLVPIPRPEFSFKGAWFKVGYEQEVHLIAGLQSTVNSGSRGNHVAFEVCNIFDFEKHLIAKNYEYQTLKQRSDKSWQLFLKDPDGYYIEMFQVHKITI